MRKWTHVQLFCRSSDLIICVICCHQAIFTGKLWSASEPRPVLPSSENKCSQGVNKFQFYLATNQPSQKMWLSVLSSFPIFIGTSNFQRYKVNIKYLMKYDSVSTSIHNPMWRNKALVFLLVTKVMKCNGLSFVLAVLNVLSNLIQTRTLRWNVLIKISG